MDKVHRVRYFAYVAEEPANNFAPHMPDAICKGKAQGKEQRHKKIQKSIGKKNCPPA